MLSLAGDVYSKFRQTTRLGLLYENDNIVSDNALRFTRYDDNNIVQLLYRNDVVYIRNIDNMGTGYVRSTINLGKIGLPLSLNLYNNFIIIITEDTTYKYPYNVTADNRFQLGDPIKTDNPNKLEDFITPKIYHNFIYTKFYQYIYVYNIDSNIWDTAITAPWFIGSCAMFLNSDGTYKFYFNSENYHYEDNITKYYYDPDKGFTLVDSTTFDVDRTFNPDNLPSKDNYPKNEVSIYGHDIYFGYKDNYSKISTLLVNILPERQWLQTGDEMLISEDNTTMYIASFNGWFYKCNINNDNTLGTFNKIFNVTGTVEKIILNKNYIIALHDINNIVLWNNSLNKVEYIDLLNESTDIECNEFLLYSYNRNLSLTIYKLQDFPGIDVDYSLIEKDNKSDNNNYYLNSHIKIMYDNDNSKKDQTGYTVNLYYRNSVDTASKFFPETNLYANLYMPLKDIDKIYKEPQFELSKDPMYYEIINTQDQIKMSNKLAKELNYFPTIYKIFIKDMYFLNENIFFRLRFILDLDYSLLVTVGDKSIMIYNGNSELALEKDYYSKLNYERHYDKNIDYDQMIHKFEWFSIKDAGFNSYPTVKFDLYQKGSLVESYETPCHMTYNNIEDIIDLDNTNSSEIPSKIKYMDTDGGIHNTEYQYLNDLENGNKDNFLNNMSNVTSEIVKNGSNIPITHEPYIHNSINDEQEYGYLDMSYSYGSYEMKQNSLISDIYINGKRMFHSSFKQFDSLNGGMFTFIAIRKIRNLIDGIDKTSKTLPANTEVILTSTRRHLYDSEKFIYEYTIDNSLENQTEMIQTTGIYIPANVPSNISAVNIKVYIMKKSYEVYRRLNPSRYFLDVDQKNNGRIHLYIYGSDICTDGTKIRFVTNGVIQGNIVYTNFKDSLYDIDSLPYVQTDDMGNIYTNTITDANDLDVNLNGLMLYPNIDYTLYNPGTMNDDNIPSMVVFRNKLPKENSTKVEFSVSNKGSNYSFYWKKPADGTTNIFSIDNDRLLFIPGTFSIFVNNYRISSSYVKVMDQKTIQINGYNQPLINVLAKFSYDSHTNLQLILDYWKYHNMNWDDKYYHSYYDKKDDSRYDVLTNNNSANDIRKLMLMNKTMQKPPVEIPSSIYDKYSKMLEDLNSYYQNQINIDTINSKHDLSLINQYKDSISKENDSYTKSLNDLQIELKDYDTDTQRQLTNLKINMQNALDLATAYDGLYKIEMSKNDTTNAQHYEDNRAAQLDIYDKLLLQYNNLLKEKDLKDKDINEKIDGLNNSHNETLNYYNDLLNTIQKEYDELIQSISNLKEVLAIKQREILNQQQAEISKIIPLNDGTHNIVINANLLDNNLWDTFIDGKPLENKYMNHNYSLNMNPTKNYYPKATITNPKI